MVRGFAQRLQESAIIGAGGAIYTVIDDPLKKLLGDKLGGFLPSDPLDPMNAFTLGFMSSFVSLTVWDLLVPRPVKKAVGGILGDKN